MKEIKHLEDLVTNRKYLLTERDGRIVECYFEVCERHYNSKFRGKNAKGNKVSGRWEMLLVFRSKPNSRGNVLFVGCFAELLRVEQVSAQGPVNLWAGEGIDTPLPTLGPQEGHGKACNCLGCRQARREAASGTDGLETEGSAAEGG